MEAEALPARRDSELEELFAPRPSGFLGADIAHSVPLGPGRTLWLFGDTLLGEMRGGQRVVKAMPRNSVAIVDHRTGLVDWSCEAERPFFRLPQSDAERWFWPGTAFVHDSVLHVFGYEVHPGPGPFESLAFRVTGSWLIRATGIAGPPSTWEFDAVPFPSAVPRALFCSAHHVGASHVHLLGFLREGEPEKGKAAAVLARMPLAALHGSDPASSLEVLAGGTEEPRWERDPARPRLLYRPGVTECSLHHDAPRGRFIATTYDAREGVLRASTSSRLEGPWSDPAPVYQVPEFLGPDHHIAYTFRMHPHLAASRDEMVFTYVVNTRSLQTLLDQPDVYFPRFIRADLRRIQNLPTGN